MRNRGIVEPPRMGYVAGVMVYPERSLRSLRIRRGLALTALALPLAAWGWLPASAGSPAGAVQEPAPPTDASAEDDALVAAFGAAGVQVDRDAGALAFFARIEVLNDALEYLLVAPQGAVHESLFVTGTDPEVLAAAALAIGVAEGTNVDYVAVEPPPTREEVRAGARTHEIIVPTGGEVYLYAAWREAAGPVDVATGTFPEETLHFHRIEDLLVDLNRGRTMRRHAWTWLGSRMVPGRADGAPETFAATQSGNLACVTFFSQGDTLITAGLPECASQTSWRPNVWMIPDRGGEVLLLASPTELAGLPPSFAQAVPFVEEPDEDDAGAGR